MEQKLYQSATCNRADPYTEPNSCLSDFSDSLNSLNSMKVLLHLEKTPLILKWIFLIQTALQNVDLYLWKLLAIKQPKISLWHHHKEICYFSPAASLYLAIISFYGIYLLIVGEMLLHSSFWHYGGLGEFLWRSGLQRRACSMDGYGFKSQTSTNACGHICRYMDQKGLATMLTSIQSAGVTPEVNLRNLLWTGEEVHKRGNPPWLWNPGQTSPEVQNRGISGPTKRTYVLQKFKKKKKEFLCRQFPDGSLALWLWLLTDNQWVQIWVLCLERKI